MTGHALEIFMKGVVERGEISLDDVRRLAREVLPDGIGSRDEADQLIALDRAVERKHGTWSAWALEAVVQFVVWTSRPTGHVDAERAAWLVASLSAGRGPTPLADAVAFEIVREAETVDTALVAFALRRAGGRLPDLSAAFEELAAA